MILTILQALYFMLPAYLANMAAVAMGRLPFWNFPVDFSCRLGGERLFGAHKTYKGLVTGTLVGVVVILIQRKLAPGVGNIHLLPYETFSVEKTIFLGALFGSGAMLGDLLKSFFKRRLRIADGRPWIPFDYLDSVIGALLTVSFFYFPPTPYIIILLVLTPPLTFLTDVTAYFLGLKKMWW